MTTTPTSGAADLLDLIEAYAEARHRQGHSSYNAQTSAALQAVKAALAAGQATAARQPHRSGCTAGTDEACVQRGCGTNCPAVSPRQGVAYAALPESFLEIPDAQDESGINAYYSREAVLECIDAALASHGQASSQAGEYPALVCDYCGALTPDPWHSSGMLHGKMSKHIHSCDACAARGAAEAQSAESVPALDRDRIREIFMAYGFTVKEGQTDLQQYVYDAADALLRAARDPADSVQEDAARYRWLAASCRSTSEHWGGRWSIIIDGPAPKSHDSEDDFDAAVDAARKQGATQ